MSSANQEPGSQQGPLRVLAVLPARLASTRLERKVLLAETGLPLFAHTASQVNRCDAIKRVLVATDGEEVMEWGTRLGIEVVMTDADHASGTDRVQEAVEQLDEAFDVILNVQADEPDVEPEDLRRLVRAFECETVEAATLATPLLSADDLASPNVVKVTRDAQGRALYFSRAPIPCRSHARDTDRAPAGAPLALRHVGVYAYRPAALARFCSLEKGALEVAENLEQLRWLEAGHAMTVVDAEHTPRGIDTREDYDAFVERHGRAHPTPTDPPIAPIAPRMESP
ncbi:MAG TPA: 3-deoxy-manno-octulosonate cytidylyltransferase [Planctomycetes bacterium]|nr:3-deoxy-manno-octulosonate cytidylyltransferase [Planctomycetota bacterium]